jgi:molecular chaperone GrpE
MLRSVASAAQYRVFFQSRNIHGSWKCIQASKDKVVLNVNPRSISLENSILFQRRFLFSSKSSTETEKPKEEGDQNAQPEISENEKILEAKVVELEEKSAELLDKYRRSLADFENLRNRMNKQVADAKVFGIQGFCKDLLDVADVLAKAVESVPQDALKSESHFLKDMHQGLKLTQNQLLHVFERHGLTQETPLGEKFDPNKHNALFQVPMPDKEPNTVVDVQKVGYILHGRTIRPAAVGVSRK